MQAADIQKLSRGAIRLRGVKNDFAFKPYRPAYLFRQLSDGHVFTHPNIDQRRLKLSAHRFIAAEQSPERVIRQIHEINTGIGHVFTVEKLPPRPAGSPNDRLPIAAYLGVVLSLIHISEPTRLGMI